MEESLSCHLVKDLNKHGERRHDFNDSGTVDSQIVETESLMNTYHGEMPRNAESAK